MAGPIEGMTRENLIVREEWYRAVNLLRRLLRQSFTPADFVPDRSAIFRIVIQEVSGRGTGETV